MSKIKHGEHVPDAVQDRLRTAIRAALAQRRTIRGIAAQSQVPQGKISAFMRGANIGPIGAKKLAKALDLDLASDQPTPAATDDLWRVAQSWKPDRVLVQLTESTTTVAVVRRDAVIRQFKARDIAAVLLEMQRCAGES